MKALRCLVLCLSVLSVLSGWSQSGCTISGACNYDPDAAVDDGSCVFENWYIPTDPFASDAEPAMFTCNPPAGYMPANDWTCMEQVLSFHPECELTDWDGICHTFYCDCAGGSGCTYPDAENYDPTAGCDDQSCTFAAACAEDLNHDCEVGTPDLLQILGAFGVTCPDCD